MLACCHQGSSSSSGLVDTQIERPAACNAPENPGCHGLAGLCCPHEDGAMLACCHQGSSSSSSLVDTQTERPAACNAPANPGCHGLAGLCCPHQDGVMLACCHQGFDHGYGYGYYYSSSLVDLETVAADDVAADADSSSSTNSTVDIETQRPCWGQCVWAGQSYSCHARVKWL